MFRHSKIAAFVLVPFGCLVAWGWWYFGLEADQRLTPAPTVDSPPHPRTPPSQPATRQRPTVEAVMDAATAQPKLPPEIRTVEAEVYRCFGDRPSKRTTAVDVRVSFQTADDGHFVGYRLEQTSERDPYFEACLEDVFAEMIADPRHGRSPGRVTHTFHFEPSQN